MPRQATVRPVLQRHFRHAAASSQAHVLGRASGTPAPSEARPKPSIWVVRADQRESAGTNRDVRLWALRPSPGWRRAGMLATSRKTIRLRMTARAPGPGCRTSASPLGCAWWGTVGIASQSLRAQLQGGPMLDIGLGNAILRRWWRNDCRIAALSRACSRVAAPRAVLSAGALEARLRRAAGSMRWPARLLAPSRRRSSLLACARVRRGPDGRGARDAAIPNALNGI